jgi:hypothetical protein
MPSLEGEMPLLLTNTAYGYLCAITLGKSCHSGIGKRAVLSRRNRRWLKYHFSWMKI